ncbi:dedicator of cytokinesis-domain-containing protein [Dipodascopsis uninucleata]
MVASVGVGTWYPLSRPIRAVAKQSYNPASSSIASALPVRLGDTIYVFEQSSRASPTWYRGYLLTSPPLDIQNENKLPEKRVYVGIVPAFAISLTEEPPSTPPTELPDRRSLPPLPSLVTTSEAENNLPLIYEISNALEEWTASIAKIFRKHLNSNFAILHALTNELSSTRKAICLDLLTENERRAAIKESVWNLVRGNKLSSGEVIVRNEKTGAIDTGVDDLVTFYRNQVAMALDTHASTALRRLKDNNRRVGRHSKLSNSGITLSGDKDLYHLLVKFDDYNSFDPSWNTRIYLCTKKGPVTEACSVGDVNGKETRALFPDLPQYYAKDDFYLVVEVYESIDTPAGRVRQGVVIGVMDVGRALRELAETDRILPVRLFASIPNQQGTPQENNGGWGTLRNRLIKGAGEGIKRYHSLDKLHFSVRGFASVNSELLIKSSPLVFGDPSLQIGSMLSTATASFSSRRDEIYVTISGAVFSPMLNLKPNFLYAITLTSKSGNLRFSSTVADHDGEPQWTSCAVSKQSLINEFVKVSPLVKDDAIMITIVCVSDGVILGRAVLPLWEDDVILSDGSRTLPMVLSSSPQPSGEITVSTQLASTEFSADAVLLGLIRWRKTRNMKDNDRTLLKVLRQMAYVDQHEVVKLLREVLDSLFGILAWKAGDNEVEDVTLTALVHVMKIVVDRGHNVALDEYVTEHFNYPVSLAPLTKSISRLLSFHLSPDYSSQVRDMLKVGKYLFRFIGAAWRIHQSRSSVMVELGSLSQTLKGTFAQFCRMIEQSPTASQVDKQTVVINQTHLLQHFHSYLPEIRDIFEEEDIVNMALDFMKSCSDFTGGSFEEAPKLISYRLTLIQKYSALWLFRDVEKKSNRNILAEHTIAWILLLLSARPPSNMSRPVWQSFIQQTRLICSVLAHQFHVLWPLRNNEQDTCILYVKLMPCLASTFCLLLDEFSARGGVKFRNEYSALFPETFPFPMPKPVDSGMIYKEPFDETLIELTLPIAILAEFSTYEVSATSSIGRELKDYEATSYITDVLRMCVAILDGKAFPKHWLSVQMFCHRAILQCLEFMALVLLEYFLPETPNVLFQDDLWRMFFETSVRLVGSPALEIENFGPQKRGAVWAITGDVRARGAILLRRMWDSIGDPVKEGLNVYGLERVCGYQTRFITNKWCGENGMISHIVELWASRHEGLREEAVKILMSMIICEWIEHGSIQELGCDIVDSLDDMFQNRDSLQSDAFSKASFLDALGSMFPDRSDPLSEQVHIFLSSLSRLLDLLIDLHTLPESDAYHDDRILCTLNLMHFLKDLHREDAFIRYVHKLVYMHERSGHFTEAGLTLGLHARMYDWRLDSMLPASTDPDFPAQTEFDRREALTLRMIEYFSEGGSPELMTAGYTELAEQYSTVTFSLDKLTNVTAAIARVYRDILSTGAYDAMQKPVPQFFRVAYLGTGFHRALRGKQYVVQGNRWEKLSEFTERMQNLYPESKVISSNTVLSSQNQQQNQTNSQAPANEKHMSTSSLNSTSSLVGSELDSQEGQFLHITAVTPEASPALAAATSMSGLPPHVYDFFLRRDLNRFSVSRPIKTNQSTSVSPVFMWVEKSIFITREAFPTILRRSEICDIQVEKMSPLASASNILVKKTAEIELATRRAHAALHAKAAPGEDSEDVHERKRAAAQQLSLLLSGSVDAPVNGGIRQYRQLLETDTIEGFGENYPFLLVDEQEYLRAMIVRHVAVLKGALIVHGKVVVPALKPLHDSLVVLLEKNFRNELQQLEEDGSSSIIDGFSGSVFDSYGRLPGEASKNASTVNLDGRYGMSLPMTNTAASARSMASLTNQENTLPLHRSQSSRSGRSQSEKSEAPSGTVANSVTTEGTVHNHRSSIGPYDGLSSSFIGISHSNSNSGVNIAGPSDSSGPNSTASSINSSKSQSIRTIGLASKMGNMTKRLSKMRLGGQSVSRSKTQRLGPFREE